MYVRYNNIYFTLNPVVLYYHHTCHKKSLLLTQCVHYDFLSLYVNNIAYRK